MNLLAQTQHRVTPLPSRPWIMHQTWHHVLFAHWPVALDALRRVVPPALTIDTFDGQAWLGIIAFRLSGIRLRGTPEAPLVGRFTEINVRTYVTVAGKPGVLFLSLDADNPLAIALAKPWFRLAYLGARIRFGMEGETVRFTSRRTERAAPPAAFAATYGPAGPVCEPVPGTLEHWLTERYCYYAVHRDRAYCCDIHHPPWPLQPATATISENTMASAHGLALREDGPRLHYARQMQAVIWSIERLPTASTPLKLPLLAGTDKVGR
ncbi:MAG TPA: DUF2071 domain-containing protein [Chloroflexia bacterium]|nr:DUF2071 domain-containing protein [Chloroflexia bacterium]